jgi:phage terminase large subunit-like protein
MQKELEKKQDFEVFDTRKVVRTLESLMTDVTKQTCNAETVNAACNCADKITDILRLHLDVERLRSRFIK